MDININELRGLIREIKEQRLKEYAETPRESEYGQFEPRNVDGVPGPHEDPETGDYQDAPDGDLTDEEKARSFEDMFQDIKNILETWKERDPATVAGKYFHDLLHLAKAYDPTYFPATEMESPEEMPDDKDKILDRTY